MMREVKICGFIASVVACLLLLAAGCANLAEETAKTRAEPEKTIETKAEVEETVKIKLEPKEAAKATVEPKEQEPTLKLALKFTPHESTTYKVITEAHKSVKFEGPVPDKGVTKGGHTGNIVEMMFIQHIQSVDDNGSATAEITIKRLKYLAEVKDYLVLDFDSSREKDQSSPLNRLIGQSYTIEITASGQVSKVIDANQARAAAKGTSSTHKTASALLSANVIKQRHTIPALPLSGKNQVSKGESWSNTNVFNFGTMGSKSYERVYTLTEIEKRDNRRIAIVKMNAIPSSERAKELHKEQVTDIFSKLFDNTETYTGELKLDLATGKVEEYSEELQSEWVIVLPSVEQGDDKEPVASIMAATRLYSIERLD